MLSMNMEDFYAITISFKTENKLVRIFSSLKIRSRLALVGEGGNKLNWN
jgi:hypothetical protein